LVVATAEKREKLRGAGGKNKDETELEKRLRVWANCHQFASLEPLLIVYDLKLSCRSEKVIISHGMAARLWVS